ncbi:hypothetical protein JOC54_001596 [Alkalihalobacillus xiaoxiensis]|uniref:Uncharacterized protein n=1 Tax=Shouchella xiaoxiensis TaxID=766895 RepID=A0ABS2SSW6_9BACI|nr:hypothetical protein [Shouchella xiaoxiensis]MBM7838340.1 hypothetical protein [Shouchella xiaoxiensis]
MAVLSLGPKPAPIPFDEYEIVSFEDGSPSIVIATYEITDVISVKVYDDEDAELCFGPHTVPFAWTPQMRAVIDDIDAYEAIELLSILAVDAEPTS